MTAVDDAPTMAGRRAWLGLAVLALPTFVVAIDLFVLMLALPDLAVTLGADANQQLWITDIYGFVLAGFLVTMGTLGDRIGRRRLLLIGSVAFGAASVACAYAPTAELLIAARAVLGITGATLMPATLALISSLFPNPRQMATAFGVWGGTFTLGAVLGPVIGGALLTSFWWGSVFLIGVPLMVLLLVLGPKLLPESRDRRPGRLDPASVVLSLLALLPVVYGVKELARHGWQVLPLLVLAAGLTFGAAFVRRQRRVADPLLDLRQFGDRVTGGSLIGLLAYSMVGGGTMLMMLMCFQLVAGMSPLEAGLAMVPGMLTGALGFQVAPRLAARFRPAAVIAVGLLGAAAGLLAMTWFDGGSGVLVVGFAAFSFFGAPMPGLGTNLVVASAPPSKAGAAGSLAQMSNELGGTLGLAIFGAVGAAVYRGVIDLPAGLPPAATSAATDSLAGAAAVVGGLPDAMAVLAPARAAFATGLHVTAAISAALLVALSAMVAIRLRSVPPFGDA